MVETCPACSRELPRCDGYVILRQNAPEWLPGLKAVWWPRPLSRGLSDGFIDRDLFRATSAQRIWHIEHPKEVKA